MKNIVVIFAGGKGARMDLEIPKQFLKIHSKEIIIHTLEKFDINENIDEIYVACIKDKIEFLEGLIKKHNIQKVKTVIPGGETGQESIFLGLKEVKKNYDNAIVLIHDGVRPLVDEKTINNCIDNVKRYGSSIVVTPCFENPIISRNGDVADEILKIKEVYTTQAPQGFYLKEIFDAHLEERKVNKDYNGVIDSCTLMTKHGKKCHLLVGNRRNIKVTTQDDYCTLIGNYSISDYKDFLNLTKEMD